MWFKTICLWIEDKWNKFEAWVASWMPSLKTRTVSGLGAIGFAAGNLQEYVSQLPLSTFMTVTQVAWLSVVLLTLTFWLRGLNDRVNVRTSPSNP